MQLTRLLMAYLEHSHLRAIFKAAVTAVRPNVLIQRHVKFENNVLTVAGDEYKLENGCCYVVGFGKACYEMAAELYHMMDKSINTGVISAPHGSVRKHRLRIQYDLSGMHERFIIHEGGRNNLPDNPAQNAANDVEDLCTSLKPDDVLIVLVSGGGSSLLVSPKPGLTLGEKYRVTLMLAHKGATIHEINVVRMKLSRLKGGGLAKCAYPAKIITLVLSDIIGNPLDLIASGPTIQPKNLFTTPEEVLKKYNLLGDVTTNVLECIRTEEDPIKSEIFDNVNNYVLGSNELACKGALEEAERLGYDAYILSTTVQGCVKEVARMYAALIKYIVGLSAHKTPFKPLLLSDEALKYIDSIKNFHKPVCLILGGEPTITVEHPDNKGGRNMHLALQLATLIYDVEEVFFLSCGTDGIDGPTDAAGACAPLLRPQELPHVRGVLQETNSYPFLCKYQAGEYLVKTGHTGTNVSDLHLIIINPRPLIAGSFSTKPPEV